MKTIVSNPSKTILLADNESAGNEIHPGAVEGIQMILNDGHEIEDVIHLQDQDQEAKQGKFDNFWTAVERVMSENDLAVAQERRHGTTSWISPLCVSLRDLMDKCEDKMQQLFPESTMNYVPSKEYFRLQFTPRNPHTRASKRYYSRFDVKYGLQVRTLRKSHPDQHYGAKQFQYMKVMASKCPESLLQQTYRRAG